MSRDVLDLPAGLHWLHWIIKAPRKVVYQAFLDQNAVASWLPPETMTGRVHIFEPREGERSETFHEIASLPTRH